MKKLIDIKGNSISVNEKEAWYGKILMSDDLSFEGIVINEESQIKSYIDGHETFKDLNIQKIDLTSEERETQYIVKKENYLYVGEYYSKKENIQGKATISILEAEKTREVTQQELKSLEFEIDGAKRFLYSESQYKKTNQKTKSIIHA